MTVSQLAGIVAINTSRQPAAEEICVMRMRTLPGTEKVAVC